MADAVDVVKVGGREPEPYRGPSLSPSRAADFTRCALQYRFRVVDRLPEEPSPEAARGSLVHGVLDQLFDLDAERRDLAAAQQLVRPAWAEVVEREPAVGGLFADDDALQAWLRSADALLAQYFSLEDPRRLAPAGRELYVETDLPSGLRLRGYVDRVDVAADGRVRVVDYKTGRSPPERYEASALFQLRFYALVLWRTRGVVPSVLRLLYLGDGSWLEHAPTEHDLLATERKVQAVWDAIALASETGDWQPRRSGACRFCAHRALCPAWGGTPPPLPEPDAP